MRAAAISERVASSRTAHSGVAIVRIPMPLRESEAIVLQSYPLGEADRLVSFLSRSIGRVRGVASGARRTKSRFGSTLVRISQCELIESFLDAFKDYESGVGLAIISEVTEAVLPDREASDANFRLLLLTAQAVKRTSKWEVPLAYFALWTVKLGGWLPPLDVCSRCGTVLSPNEPAYFSRSSSALLCAKCRKPGLRVIPATALVAARKMLAQRLDKFAQGEISDSAARELTDITLDVIERQIDRKLKSRELLEPTA